MRGGTFKLSLDALRVEGLSPLARGNPLRLRGPLIGNGPIPACAGEPLVTARLAKQAGAYPRLRGGTCNRCKTTLLLWGLSPLARGNQGKQNIASHCPRPIPACAGEPQKAR